MDLNARGRKYLLLLVLSLVCACGGGARGSEDTTAPNLLLANSHGLTQSQAGKQKSLIQVEPGATVLTPAISRDGKQLAYILQSPLRSNGDYGSDLYISKRDGSGPRLVVQHAAISEFIRSPAWKPDGTLLITVLGHKAGGAPDWRIESLDPVTGRRERLINDAVGAAVSPDGKLATYLAVAYDGQTRDLKIVDLSNIGLPKDLAGGQNHLSVESATWSPDGKRIAFGAVDLNAPAETTPAPNQQRFAHPGAQDVWLVNPDGTDLHRLAELADKLVSLAWSPDGSAIYAFGLTGFWRIDAATGSKEPVPFSSPLGDILVLQP